MIPLIRKEIRLILPFWAIAMFLAIVPSILVPRETFPTGINELIIWAFCFGAVLLGLAPFGQEFALGTFSPLLAQPFERRRIWTTKVVTILVAGLLLFLAFALVVHFRLDVTLREVLQRHALSYPQSEESWKAYRRLQTEDTIRDFYHSEFWRSCVAGGALATLVAVVGGFWTTLLFRQIGAALWFSILVPGVILVASEGVGHVFAVDPNMFLIPALVVYAAAGFIWARHMFFKAQDTQWLGGTIAMLSLTSAEPRTDTAEARGKKPLVAMLLKELQSHQISLLIGFGLLVLHITTLLVRRVIPMSRNSEMRFAVEAVPFLWLLIAWVVGCVAVAEERKLGTLEGQLCLPVSRRLQFASKFAVVLLLGVALGGLMPCLMEGLGVLVGIPSQIVQPQGANNPSTYFATVGEVMLAAGAIAVISCFASTLTRNTLHALGAAIPIAGIFIALFEWAALGGYHYGYYLWHGPLILVMGIPVCLITVIWLSFANYRHLHAGRNVWLRNLLVLSVTLFCTGIAVAIIYQRPWELAMSVEPKHGLARLNGTVRPEICLSAERTFALLPDGRLWAATDFQWKEVARYHNDANGTDRTSEEIARMPVPHSGMFIGGSNWMALAANNSTEVIALQLDGSLWSVISVGNGRDFWNRWLRAAPEPRRIGADNDWKSIACGNGYSVAVKQDGTLWLWGYNYGDRFGLGSTNDIGQPVRFGTNSDWAEVHSGVGSPLLVKQDGDVWEWIPGPRAFELHLARANLNAADWADADFGFNRLLVVHRDGSLWGRGWGNFFGAHLHSTGSADPLFRIGNNTDWLRARGDGPFPIGIKANGRLVRTGTELFSTTLGRPSAYRDWLAIDSHWQNYVALNADGTVSLWCDTRSWDPGRKLLASSHRPLWSLNVFTDSKN